MFEFHGWVTVRYHTHDTDAGLQNKCWNAVTEYVAALPTELVRLQRYNGCDTVTISGQHNHHGEYVTDVLHWIAENAPGSYGLLYIHDDEGEFENEFRVWRLRRGKVDQLADPFLSPYVPTVEDPYDPERGD